LGEVDRDGQLAAIAGEVIRGLARIAPFDVLQERRAPRARVVAAAGPFDLDDRCAEIGEELRALRAREDAREVEDREMGERAGHGGLRQLHGPRLYAVRRTPIARPAHGKS